MSIAVARNATVDAILAEVKIAIIAYRAVEVRVRNSPITTVAADCEWSLQVFYQLANCGNFSSFGIFLFLHD